MSASGDGLRPVSLKSRIPLPVRALMKARIVPAASRMPATRTIEVAAEGDGDGEHHGGHDVQEEGLPDVARDVLVAVEVELQVHEPPGEEQRSGEVTKSAPVPKKGHGHRHAYTKRAGRVELDGIDFDDFRTHRSTSGTLRCLRYMHDVEHHTVCYLRDLLVTSAHRDPEVTSFLTMWAFEEYWHGDAIGAVLAAHGEAAGRADRVGARGAAVERPGRADAALARVVAGRRVLRRRAHDVGRRERMDHAGGLRPARGAGRAPDARRAAAADHAPGGPPHRLLRHAGRAPPPRRPLPASASPVSLSAGSGSRSART